MGTCRRFELDLEDDDDDDDDDDSCDDDADVCKGAAKQNSTTPQTKCKTKKASQRQELLLSLGQTRGGRGQAQAGRQG